MPSYPLLSTIHLLIWHSNWFSSVLLSSMHTAIRHCDCIVLPQTQSNASISKYLLVVSLIVIPNVCQSTTLVMITSILTCTFASSLFSHLTCLLHCLALAYNTNYVHCFFLEAQDCSATSMFLTWTCVCLLVIQVCDKVCTQCWCIQVKNQVVFQT